MEKPFKRYFGGKNGAGVYQQIINCMRPHDVYMELFLGSGAVYLNKKPASISIRNDLDLVVVERWKALDIAVFNLDAIEILKTYTWQSQYRYCVYLDPPYPLSSRRSSVDVYNYEMTDRQHEELLTVVRQLPSNVDILISTYENDLYKEYLTDWPYITFTGQTRQGPATEYLYMNYYNDSGLLHDYGFIGQDRTDRQRIKRKISREIDKLKALPATERNAIIFAVLDSCSVDRNGFGRQ